MGKNLSNLIDLRLVFKTVQMTDDTTALLSAVKQPKDDGDGAPAIRYRQTEKQTSTPKKTDKEIFPPNQIYLIIIFSERVKRSTVEDVDRIVQEFNMITNLEILSKTEKHLYISATTDTLLKLADEYELIKKTINGSMQKFNYYSKTDFLIGDMTEDEILTNAECGVLIKDAIKPSLLPYLRNGTIAYLFPAHDLEYLSKFKVRLGHKLPIEDIQNYYGSSIGIYFAFIQFYTAALLFPALYGVLQYFLGFNLATVCGFYMLWTTIFLELWKRKCSGLAYRWGTIEMTSLDKPRTAYYGEMKPDPVTGKLTPQYPIRYTYLQMYLVSYPIVALCVLAAMYFALYQFQIEAEVLHDFGRESLLLYVPGIVQSILIAIFSWAYEKLATFLTDNENHRTRSQWERHRVNKLMIFEIVNNFFSLFYIAFILQDLGQLKYQLMTQLLIFQVVQLIQEIGFPLIAVAKQKYTQHIKEISETKRSLIVDIARYKQACYESGLDEYNSTYEDYLQICTQFGYVVLFAAVAPFAALCALLNNFFGIYIDLFKINHFYKRPFARRAKNIGAWQSALELLSVLAILSNCGLLYLQPNLRDYATNLFSITPLLTFVIFEHILLAVKFFLHKAIHDQPRWVRVSMAKGDYESSEALKHLRRVVTGKLLRRENTM